MLTHKIWEMAQFGAEWVLYLLLLLSIASIALMIERSIYFWRARINLEMMRYDLRIMMERGETKQAIQYFKDDPGVPATILREALESAHDGADAAEERSIGVRGAQKLKLERGLAFLGTLGNNAPFIGLFGTVLGIINAFSDLSGTQLQLAGPKIMGSISEALVATAVGLIVALPAVVAFNIFNRRVKFVLAQADILLHDLLAYLRGQESQDPMFEAPEIIPSGSQASLPRL